jgi:hypothetical protein
MQKLFLPGSPNVGAVPWWVRYYHLDLPLPSVVKDFSPVEVVSHGIFILSVNK